MQYEVTGEAWILLFVGLQLSHTCLCRLTGNSLVGQFRQLPSCTEHYPVEENQILDTRSGWNNDIFMWNKWLIDLLLKLVVAETFLLHCLVCIKVLFKWCKCTGTVQTGPHWLGVNVYCSLVPKNSLWCLARKKRLFQLCMHVYLQ